MFIILLLVLFLDIVEGFVLLLCNFWVDDDEDFDFIIGEYFFNVLFIL